MKYTIGEYQCPFCGKKLYEKNRRISGTGNVINTVNIYYLCGNCDTKIEHVEKEWESCVMDIKTA